MPAIPEAPKSWPRHAPFSVHVLAKPTGAICNLIDRPMKVMAALRCRGKSTAEIMRLRTALKTGVRKDIHATTD